MNIHQKINNRNKVLVKRYLDSLFRNHDLTIKELIQKAKISKNLAYGGYRNTCYDVNKD